MMVVSMAEFDGNGDPREEERNWRAGIIIISAARPS